MCMYVFAGLEPEKEKKVYWKPENEGKSVFQWKKIS